MRSSLFLVAMLTTLSVACGSDNPTAPKDQELDRARSATTRYADLSAALADGYADINVVMPGMGRHFMKQSLVDDRFEIDKPEILVYATVAGKQQLVAVEYAVPLDKSVSAPSGFTGDDDVWDRNTGFQLWLLHAWVHLENRDGVFKSHNPILPLNSCGWPRRDRTLILFGSTCGFDVQVSHLRGGIMKKGFACCAVLLAASTAVAQSPSQAGAAKAVVSMGGGNCLRAPRDSAAGRGGRGGPPRGNEWNCSDTKNPIATPNTIWFEEMTWMDVRDAIANGKNAIIIPTGGLEPNGPWLVTGKHNYVLTANCEAIARKLGNALCAPVVKFVPEGRIDPPSSHMVSPNTISMREETFRMMLTDIVHSLKQHGFKQIFLIGDSGGNQAGQRWVADSLTKIWNGDPIVAHIQEYYDYASAARFMEDKGIKEDSTKAENLHDDPIITLNMYIADPKSVRYDERVKAGKASINGISIADKNKNMQLAKQIVEFRATSTVEAMKKAIANKGTLPAPAGRGRGGPP